MKSKDESASDAIFNPLIKDLPEIRFAPDTSLKTQLRRHNLKSAEPIDLHERIELIDQASKLPMKQLCELVKSLGDEKGREVLDLVRIFLGTKDE